MNDAIIYIIVLLAVLVAGVATCMVLILRRGSKPVEEKPEVSTADLLKEQAARFDEINRRTIEEMQRQQDIRIEAEREASRRQLVEETERRRRELADAERRYEERIKEINDRMERRMLELREQSSAEFRNMAAQALKENSSGLKQANNEQIEALLKPLKERIEEFNRACTDSYMKENASRKSLYDQIERLMQTNHTIGEEARNLTNALRNDSQKQGRWGEIVLETLLEKAGMTRGVNFLVQQTRDSAGETMRDESGRGQRPDVVILLPGKHNIIVDSKVSLKSYVDYCNADSKEERDSFGRQLVESVRKHIKELADKNYQGSVKDSAEHVLMFIPNEGAYLAAVQIDPDIWNYAYERKVVIVSPAHLFSVVQLVAQMWRQENQNRNAESIARLGGYLYDKFVAFCSDMKKIEKNLSDAQRAYDACYKGLTQGGTSLVRRAERLRELGAKTSKVINERMREDSLASEEAALPLPDDGGPHIQDADLK